MAAKPTIKQLTYLCAVARTLHFGRAAAACHVTQSTLSAGIHELEQALGVTLLERSNKQVLLTDIGRGIVRRAQQVLTEVDQLVETAAAASEPLTGRLELGVIPTVAPFVLPQLLSSLRSDSPRLQMLIREDLSANLVSLLAEGDLDLILLALPYPMENVTTRHLFYDQLLLAYPGEHPIGKSAHLRTRDLVKLDLLLLEEGHCLRDHVLEACRLKEQQISQAYAATSLHTIVQMVAGGIGVTLLPKMCVDAGILAGTNVETRPFEERKVWRSIGFGWRKGTPREEEFELLADYLVQLNGN